METLSPVFVQTVIQLLGLPGLIFIIWHFDNKRLDKQREADKEQQQLMRDSYEDQQRKLRSAYECEHKADREQNSKLLGLYREDIGAIKSLYANNAHLVGDYDKAMTRLEKLAGEMLSVVSLNAQTNTHLADAIKNNTFCPNVRELMGKTK